ncbi:double zinc ribbon domain-containing protein [Sulfuriferula sp. GW1]|uniref:double zinc ribbon domain-containing protein n=1 Tax=Sulfuriferula sp. GW1 TaxID=3345111 RepID=UPI0039AED4BE
MQTLLPQDCLLCGAFSGRAKLCAGCAADLPYHNQACCPVCALPTLDGKVCGHCLKRAPHFAHTWAAFTYAFPLDRLVQSLKYSHNFAVVSLLADSLAMQVKGKPLPDALIPMPLHPNRLRQRGFNQAHEIARHVAHNLHLPVLPHAASRVIDTPPQTSLPLKERRKNLRGAFACDPSIRGKRVAIVDDVMTSGSTLDTLAETLLKAGALEVQCWVIARALQHGF